MTADSYHNQSQQILMSVVEYLAGAPLEARALTDMARDLAHSRDQTFRALKNLEQAGWAQQSGNAWRLSPHLTRISESLRLAIADIHHLYLTGDSDANKSGSR